MKNLVGFLRLEVYSDDKEYIEWSKDKEERNTLFDFASYKLNQLLNSRDYEDDVTGIINIEHIFSTSEIRPKQNNSSTWYIKHTLTLLVWYEQRKRGCVLL